MKNLLKLFGKYTILFIIGGIVYNLIEILWRGYTHWTMFILGGICFICLGLINEFIPWNMPLCIQMLIGAVTITTLEYITGYIVNIKLGMNVWDYSNLPFNLNGQICLLFSVLWYFISVIGIILDDIIRWKLFKEEKPTYKII